MQKNIERAAESKNTQNDEYDSLFRQYIEVCNKSIEANKDKFPYKEIWGAGFKPFMEGYKHSFTIYDNRPKGIYNVHMPEDTQLKIIKDEKPDPQKSWPLNYSYMQHVVNNVEDHIANPAKLDWSWLKSLGE